MMHQSMHVLLATALAASTSASVLHELVGAPPDSGAIDSLAKSLDAGHDINEIGPHGGQTPLMQAVLTGNDAAVKLLLARGADTTIGEKDGYTPCHGAGFQGRAAIMKALIAHGLPCTTDRHGDGFTPLHRACWGHEARHTETVRVLLKAGAPVDQPTNTGQLPVDITKNEATRKLLSFRMNKKKKAETEAAKGEL